MSHAVALDRVARSLGLETVNCASMLHQIGYLTNEQGNYAAALDWYQRALRIKEKALGPDHPSTGTTYNNIGVLYYNQEYNQGDFREALDWLEKALAVRMNVLGPEHPYTKKTKESIANARQELSGGKLKRWISAIWRKLSGGA